MEAIKLRAAARILVAGRAAVDPRIVRMADTPTEAWTPRMVSAAAAILAEHDATLRAAGFDTRILTPESTPATAGTAPDDPAVAAALAAIDLPRPRKSDTPTIDPDEPFTYDHTIDGLRGIPLSDLAAVRGEKQAANLANYGLKSVYHLLTHIPRRYIDRTDNVPIADLVVGVEGTTIATVTSSVPSALPSGTRVARISLRDNTGTIDCTFFNMAWKASMFTPGDEVVVQGRLDAWTSDKGKAYLRMNNPLIDRTGSNTAPIIPVYPQSRNKSNVTTWQIHRAAMEAVHRMGHITDPVPADVVDGGPHLMSRTEAYRHVHLPTTDRLEAAARDRLAYDELLRMQLALRMHRLAEQAHSGVTHRPTGYLTSQLEASLPFAFTGAQQRATAAILSDLTSATPMHRLAQGDVGAGKTLVALYAILAAVEGGYQAALMAPTEVLATQHYLELIDRLDGITKPDGSALVVRTLTNRVMTRERRETLAGLVDGSVDIIVGTHALISDDVRILNLGLAVVDEQHRFGVEQRARIADRGDDTRADLLVMTATPIPRTAAMTVFGDLDVTVIDELPPGRTPIRTSWHAENPNPADPDDPVWSQVRTMVEQGRQAYVVCPLVEDSETKAAASAESTKEALADGALSGLRIGIVHGKQKAAERAPIMEAFKAGDIDVLVATTVIEVGISVPNAAIIVILEPKSFGIAQLHQLRGRVGRGQWASTCILAGEANTADTEQRLQALVDSTDGFALSEVDLRLRGPGQILGSQQSGLSDLRVANLSTDQRLLNLARDDAAKLLTNDPTLARRPGLRAEVSNALGPDAERYLTAS